MKKILIISILLSFCLVLGCTKNTKTYKDEAKIYITSDTHFYSRSLVDDKSSLRKEGYISDLKMNHLIPEICESFFEDILNDKPDYLIITGDLSFSGEKASHIDLANHLKKIEKNGTAVFVVPGNHDINSRSSCDYKGGETKTTSSVSYEEFLKIYKNYGYNEAIYKDNNSFSYFTKLTNNLYLLMLDTAKYDDHQEISGRVKDSSFELIRKSIDYLDEVDGKMIVASHHNINCHNDLFKTNYQIENSDEVKELIKDRCILYFSGHMHIQSIKEESIPEILNESLACAPCQYGVLDVSNDSFNYKTQIINMKEYAEKHNINDERLLDFNYYSKEFMMKISYTKTYERNMGQTPDDKIASAFAFFHKYLDYAYFSGHVTKDIIELLENDEKYQVILRYKNEWGTKYLLSCMKEIDFSFYSSSK